MVAGDRTDFPNAHVYRVGREKFGELGGRFCRALIRGYVEITYREFDHVYTLGEAARSAQGDAHQRAAVGSRCRAVRDRVPSGTGLLGPVDDVGPTAANVAAMWHSGIVAAGRAGRARAERQSWRRTFATLFDQVYPAAMAHTAQRLRTRGWWELR